MQLKSGVVPRVGREREVERSEKMRVGVLRAGYVRQGVDGRAEIRAHQRGKSETRNCEVNIGVTPEPERKGEIIRAMDLSSLSTCVT